jgi:hypothetical protein
VTTARPQAAPSAAAAVTSVAPQYTLRDRRLTRDQAAGDNMVGHHTSAAISVRVWQASR